MSKILVIEFDGTITQQGTWPHIGTLKPMVVQSLKKMQDSGYRIIISSTRNNPKLPGNQELKYFYEMVDFICENDIPYDEIDDGKRGKPLGDIYISHRNLKFCDNWVDTMYRIMYNRGLRKKETKRQVKNREDEGWLDGAGEV